MRRLLTSLAVALLAALLAPAAATATVRFVSPTGSDSGNCSAAGSPCATIGYAVGQAVDGADEIRLAAGTYAEAVDTTKRLSYTGAGANSTKVEPATAGAHAFSLPRGGTLRSLHAIGADGVDDVSGGYGVLSVVTALGTFPLALSDVVVDGGVSGASAIGSPAGLGAFSNDATRKIAVTALRSTFVAGSGGAIIAPAGMEIAGPGTLALVDSTVLGGTAQFSVALHVQDGAVAQVDRGRIEAAAAGTTGLLVEDATATVRRATVSATRQGVTVAAAGGGTSKATLSNSVASVASTVPADPGDSVFAAGALTTGGSASLTATGSTFAVRGPSADAAVIAQRLGAGSPVATLRNTVARLISSSEPGGADAVADGALVSAGTSGFTTVRTASGGIVTPPTSAGNVSGDPRFVAPLAGDLSLLATSPLVDRGDAAHVAAGETDLVGRVRSLDGNGDCVPHPDVGAYERPSTCKQTTTNVPPRLSKVSLVRKRFTSRKPERSGRRQGSRLRFTLSEDARVVIAIDRRLPGRRVEVKGKRRCVRTTRANRRRARCVRHARIGSLRADGKQGANRVRLSGRLRGRALRPGRYRLSVVATDAGGAKSKRVTLRFRILAP